MVLPTMSRLPDRLREPKDLRTWVIYETSSSMTIRRNFSCSPHVELNPDARSSITRTFDFC